MLDLLMKTLVLRKGKPSVPSLINYIVSHAPFPGPTNTGNGTIGNRFIVGGKDLRVHKIRLKTYSNINYRTGLWIVSGSVNLVDVVIPGVARQWVDFELENPVVLSKNTTHVIGYHASWWDRYTSIPIDSGYSVTADATQRGSVWRSTSFGMPTNAINDSRLVNISFLYEVIE